MTSDEVRDRLRARLKELNGPVTDPIGETVDFLGTHFADALDYDEALADMRAVAAYTDRSVRRGLSALRAVLALPPDEADVLKLVALEANFSLTNPGPDVARAWLERLATDVEALLRDRE